jgi:antitoxin (DNA-binding transcriptional repressor) of toxin-antitoxin stability system
MKTIGVRELRQRASAVLHLAERGETFQVTDRGRPVALITPLPSESPLDFLRAVGDVSSPSGDLGDLPLPLELRPGDVAPSVVLARLRAHER